MAKILVTGSNGQLGMELQQLSASFPQHQFHFASKSEIDITSKDLKKIITELSPDFLINAAAYTAVDLAESNPENAFEINSRAVGYLASVAEECGTIFVHISSDYVYNLFKYGPLKESDQTKPVGVYANSKREGEQLAMANCSKCIIVRTSWLYSKYGNNFVKTMLDLSETRNELTVVADQWGTPTSAKDLAATLLQIIEVLKESHEFYDWGIYNFSNEGVVSWYDFADAIFSITEKDIVLHQTTTESYASAAPRPLWSVMSKQKIKRIFGVETRHWRTSLKECLYEMDNVR